MNFVSILLFALELYSLAIVIRVLSSWIPGMHDSMFGRYLADVTDPIMAPFSKIIPPVAGLDLSPMAVLLFLGMVEGLLRMTLVS